MRGAVFDLDGTLADTSADLIAGANAALAEVGARGRLDLQADAGLSGRGGRAMLRTGFARSGLAEAEIEAAVEAALAPFFAAYESRIADASVLFPGVEAALDAIEGAGWRLAVCTNKPERLARILLAELRLLDRFGAVVGADTLPVRKPDPRPFVHAAKGAGALAARSVMIGDTATDRETARAAGAPAVLMDLGVSADDVHALGAERVLRGYAELPAALEALIAASIDVGDAGGSA
ncbi:MAG: HAD-IA family hydrolase [Paracoccaceae bacterium]